MRFFLLWALAGLLAGTAPARARAPAVGVIQTSATTFKVQWDHVRPEEHTAMQFQVQLWRPQVSGGTAVWSTKTWSEANLTLLSRRTEVRSVDLDGDGVPGDVVFLISSWESPDLSVSEISPDGPYELRLRARHTIGGTTTNSAWLAAAFTWPLSGSPPVITLRPPGKPTAHR